jgi:putative flippase GtrA
VSPSAKLTAQKREFEQMMERARNNGWSASLTKHIPPRQLARYLVVGVWNTLFGYGTFALFTALLMPVLPYGYVVALLLSSLLNITVSYLGYKWFVFKTKGNYVREWMRCVAVYSSGIVLGACLLPIVVYILRHGTRFQAAAPYLGGALLTGLGVLYNFLGNKKFSFRQPE